MAGPPVIRQMQAIPDNGPLQFCLDPSVSEGGGLGPHHQGDRCLRSVQVGREVGSVLEVHRVQIVLPLPLSTGAGWKSLIEMQRLLACVIR